MSRKRWTIAFSPAAEGTYRVEVRRSGAVHRFETALPPDISDLWDEAAAPGGTTRSFRSGEAATLTPEQRFFQAADLPTLKDIGERVLACLFDLKNTEEGSKMLGALEDRIADVDGVELEIDLSQTAELSGIPWESLYLRSRDRFLAIGTSSNIVRRLDAQAELPPPIERPIRILVAAANPRDDLETGTELGNITRRISELVAEGDNDFEIASLPEAKRDEFRRKVNEWRPHIIHYIGHSSFDGREGYLYFEGEEEGTSDRVSAETLRNMLLNQRPWLVVLNSCQSGATSREAPMAGMAQNLLQRLNVPFVVAMQQPVSDDAAINFSQDFYTALTSDEPVASAVSIGRCAIANDADELTRCELITPVLYTSGDADRLQFAAAPEPAQEAVPAGNAAATTKEDEPSFLQSLDTSTKTIASIIGSVTAIGAAAFGVWQFMASGTAETAGPQVVTSATVSPAATGEPAPAGNGTATDPAVQPVRADNGTAAVPDDESPPVFTSNEGPAPATRRGQPDVAAAAAEPQIESEPRRVRRMLVRQVDAAATTSGGYYTLPDGREVFVPDAQPDAMAAPPPRDLPIVVGSSTAYAASGGSSFARPFEQPGAPIPATELAEAGPLGEPYASEFLPTPDYPEVFIALQHAPPRAPVVCDGKALTVYYDLGATVPVPGDLDRLTDFAQHLGCPRSKAVVAGFTDTTGSEATNIAVSLDRATAVLDQLQPYGDMFVTRDANAYAESNLAVPTGDGVAEEGNRRAEIYLDYYCPMPSEIVSSLGPGEVYQAGQGAAPYAGTTAQPRPVIVALQQRGLSAGPDDEAVRWLVDTAQAVETDIGAPTGMVFPMIVGGSCLEDGQDTRIDVIYDRAPTPAP